MTRSSLAALALALAGCVAGEGIGASEQEIVDGVPEEGRPAVIYLAHHAACTGAIIAPRVVLTADHCVEGALPSSMRVFVGNARGSFTAEYRVSAVRRLPEADGEIGIGRANDIALLVLASDADVEPMEISRENPVALRGKTVTAVGFGVTPEHTSGVKLTTTTTVSQVFGGIIFVPPSVCSGDSGGPLIGEDGLIHGVASFIYSEDNVTEPRCGTAPGAYNEIYRHLDFIHSVLEETGICVPQEEICDGKDNDCDGIVDEDCLAMGSPCEDSGECLGGLCDDTPIGRICTSECDPFRPGLGCDPGFHCMADRCEGRCVPGTAGEQPHGAACTANTDCASLFCADPGDGRRRCLQACRADAGFCPSGEVCAAAAGSCGACVAKEIFAGARGLGEPCERDEQCRGEMVCHESGGSAECASSCAEGQPCASGFECRAGLCVRDRRQGVGGICLEHADCPGSVCAEQGERRWCTVQCRDRDDCPRGFDCLPGGGTMVCAPRLALEGESCVADDECVTGLCAAGVCTRACGGGDGSACPPGLECRRTDDGLGALCLPPVVEEEPGGGCSVRPSGGSALWLVGLLAALALMIARRRR